MKKHVCMVVFALLLSFSPALFAEEAWLENLDDGLKAAQVANKLVLADFTAVWCKWCKELKLQVFDQAEFTEFAAKNLVLVSVDADQNRELVDKYGVKGYPTVLIMSADGKVLEKLEGFKKLPEFMAALKKTESLKPAEGKKPEPAPEKK
jgi:thiol:disulfide interchange protein